MVKLSLLIFAMSSVASVAPAAMGWFTTGSLVAGVAVAIWLQHRPGPQLFLKAEEQPKKVEREQIDWWRMTVSAAFVLGILFGYLLAGLITTQLHAQCLLRLQNFT